MNKEKQMKRIEEKIGIIESKITMLQLDKITLIKKLRELRYEN